MFSLACSLQQGHEPRVISNWKQNCGTSLVVKKVLGNNLNCIQRSLEQNFRDVACPTSYIQGGLVLALHLTAQTQK